MIISTNELIRKDEVIHNIRESLKDTHECDMFYKGVAFAIEVISKQDPYCTIGSPALSNVTQRSSYMCD